MIAEELDQKFEAAEDITEYLDLQKAERPGLQQRRVSVDFPAWMVRELDQEAERLGVTRQSIIKFWISERLTLSHT
ncbi:MAG: CopG family antitoxin [Bacteroidota bacterium]